jgi:hypothetical protein
VQYDETKGSKEYLNSSENSLKLVEFCFIPNKNFEKTTEDKMKHAVTSRAKKRDLYYCSEKICTSMTKADDENAGRDKVFVTMGSTFSKDHMLEAIKAVCKGNFDSIVAVAPSRCRISDIQQELEKDGYMLQVLGDIVRHRVV